MKKYFPIVLLLATLTLSACGTAKTETVNNGETSQNNQETTKTPELKSLKDLIGLGTSQKCTYESNEDGETIKGEILVNGKKFKQNVEITNKDGTMKVYAISDGTYFYSWGDATGGNGTKIKMDELEDSSNVSDVGSTVGAEKQQEANMNKKVDYKCSPATLSESDLVLPTGIKFIDFSEMMKNLKDGNLEQLKNLAPQE